jgi:hypothetical protein
LDNHNFGLRTVVPKVPTLNPSDYRSCLSPRALAHLRESCLALGERQYLASTVWAAVFLEALVDDFAQSIPLPRPGQDDLNGRIQQLQQWNRNSSTGSLAVPDEIFKRFHDVRNTRNRLVHDTGATKDTLAQDAEFIHAGLKVVLDWYQKLPRPKPTEPVLRESAPHKERIPVFISTITPDNPHQTYFLDELMERLRGIGVEPIRCVPNGYDRNDPIGKLRSVIASCWGAIVVGLERTHAYFLRDREGTAREQDVTHRQYTSGWLHLEAGLANAVGLDVFVLCQKKIHSDGIFDRGWNTYHVVEIESLDANSPEVDEFLQHVRTWAAERTQSGKGRGSQITPNKALQQTVHANAASSSSTALPA